MVIKDQLKALTQKEMDRKDFLKHIGLMLAIFVGLGSLTKMIKPNVAAKTGYGSSTYGGNRSNRT